MTMDGRVGLPENQAGETPPQPGVRLLLATVYIMGIVLVLLLIGLVGGIIWKMSNNKDQAAVPAAVPVLDLGLAAGVSVQNMAVDGDRLVLNTGSEILVVDLKRSRVVLRIQTGPK
jgi:hypothetical protein